MDGQNTEVEAKGSAQTFKKVRTWVESLDSMLKALLGLGGTLGLVWAAITGLGGIQERAAAGEARQAYLALVQAFNAGDAVAYRSAFSEHLDCFYTQPAPSSAPASRVRSGVRLYVTADNLLVQSADDHKVVLCDHGSWSPPPRPGVKTKRLPHTKTIVLQSFEGHWKVTSEVSRQAHACYVDQLCL